MRYVERSIFVSAPVEQVYDLASDPSRAPEWMPWIHEVADVHAERHGLGDSFRFTDRLLGRKVACQTVVTAAQRPTLLTLETTFEDGTRSIWAMHFAPADGGTRVRSTIWYALPSSVIGHAEELFARPFIDHRLRDSGERLAAMASASAG
jgi:uncharacterized membrane protein